ncbi:MAG TPA: hypothetical protein DCG47_07950 [Spirochaetaceae bacterium]|jgi:hypothetical protein|nr:hypothetical protein [Spirochaetaceae bacterium]
MLKKRSALFAMAMMALTLLGAFQWPVKPEALRLNFGSYASGFYKGIELNLPDAPVLAPAKGEMLFAHDSPRLPGGYPMPGGSLAALAHSSGIISIYTGMQPGSLANYRGVVEQSEILGMSPVQGSGRYLGFYLYDQRERRYINPHILLAATPDARVPLIRSVALVSGGQEQILERNSVIRQGSWRFVIDAIDLTALGLPGAPFDVAVALDGSERFRVKYDSARMAAGQSLLFSDNVQSERDYLLADGRISFGPITLTKGRSSITVSATDLTGNKREISYTITVQ